MGSANFDSDFVPVCSSPPRASAFVVFLNDRLFVDHFIDVPKDVFAFFARETLQPVAVLRENVGHFLLCVRERDFVDETEHWIGHHSLERGLKCIFREKVAELAFCFPWHVLAQLFSSNFSR